MIHERQLTKNLSVSGPLTTCIASIKATLNELEASISIQNEGFSNLILGSQLKLEDVIRRASENWYVEAEEAKQLCLIEGIV